VQKQVPCRIVVLLAPCTTLPHLHLKKNIFQAGATEMTDQQVWRKAERDAAEEWYYDKAFRLMELGQIRREQKAAVHAQLRAEGHNPGVLHEAGWLSLGDLVDFIRQIHGSNMVTLARDKRILVAKVLRRMDREGKLDTSWGLSRSGKEQRQHALR
jgi:hypothetical protein